MTKLFLFVARRWLEQPGIDDRGLGRQAIALVVEDGLKIATVLPGKDPIRYLEPSAIRFHDKFV